MGVNNDKYSEIMSTRDYLLGKRKCPVCGKFANSRYYDEIKKKYVYGHKQFYKPSIVHEADK